MEGSGHSDNGSKATEIECWGFGKLKEGF